jgi:hypothetical protein
MTKSLELINLAQAHSIVAKVNRDGTGVLVAHFEGKDRKYTKWIDTYATSDETYAAKDWLLKYLTGSISYATWNIGRLNVENRKEE